MAEQKMSLDPAKYNKGPANGQRMKYGSATIYRDPLDKEPEKRRALCYCSNTKISSSDTVPFRMPQPDEQFDSYYCGCDGWD